ncbi:hypothetical protein LY90DRAFT_217575, partial [Neocallimastix californiae]
FFFLLFFLIYTALEFIKLIQKKRKLSLFFHHGAGLSGLSYALLAEYLKKLKTINVVYYVMTVVVMVKLLLLMTKIFPSKLLVKI